MGKFEEKLKEFFGDKEKVKEFVKDEEFIDKVSEGTATEQNYIDEFKKFGIDFTESEAKDILEKTDKILSIPAEKLDDEAILNVAGGVSENVMLGVKIGSGMSAAIFAGFGLPCGVAALCCAANAKKARNRGDQEEAAKCSKNADTLGKTAALCLGGGISVSAGIGAAVAIFGS